ncbi:MAG: amidohydrolase family protein [Planctomycetota bacterium]
MPGIIDTHSHLGMDAANEGPLAITAEVNVADAINPTSVGIFRALAGGTTTHHVMHGSANPIGGQNAILKLKYGMTARDMLLSDAPRTVKFATGENVKQSNRDSARGKRFPNSRMGVEDVYREAFHAGRQYIRSLETYDQQTASGVDAAPIRRDLRLEAMADVLRGNLTIHAHCYRSDEILRLLQVAEDNGVRVGVLHHVLEGYRLAPELARHGCGASTFSNFWAYKVEAYGAIPHNAALLSRAGVCATVNSDSANTIRYLGQEAAKSIRWGGLNELESLRLVTLNAARQLQLEDRMGSLDVGKDADLAIFNGHPLNTFSRCVMTVIDGEIFFEDDDRTAYEPCDSVSIPGDVDMTIPRTVHQAYAITGATVHPITGPVIEDGTVVTVDDRIHAVGSNVDIPPGAGIIDGRGLHVYPGLIDCGNTIGLTEIGSLRATRDSREIATFSPQLKTASAIHPHSAHVRISRVAGTTTAVSHPSGSRIAGQGSIINLDGWTLPEMLVEETFALYATVPSLPVRLSTDKKRRKKQQDDYDKSVKELNDFLDTAKHYARVAALPESEGIRHEPNRALDAMIPYLAGEKPVVFRANSYKHLIDTIAFIEKHKFRAVILGGRESWKLADELAARDIPVILSTPLSYPSGEFEPWDSVYRCASVLDKAGARFCFASDSYEHAYDLGTMAGMAVAFGLPAQRAEYALTQGAAQILGIDDRVGSIEAGKVANLIITTGSPLQTSSVVSHMLIRGEPVSLASMHTESYDKFRNRPAPSLPPLPVLVGPPSMTGR